MSQANEKADVSRRSFVKETGMLAAASSLVAAAAPRVHAAEDNTIQVALVGCGGRGTGAATNALKVDNGPIKLVGMADVFPNKLNSSYTQLADGNKSKVDVPEDRRYIGFDGYKKAMDLLKPGDVVILATPPAFRWVHFTYAIEKGLNVFMEKPVTVDGPSSRKMLELAEKSVAKNMKVGVGLMCRHCVARQELHDRIQGGEIGDIVLMRAYRMAGPTGSAAALKKPKDESELMYQIRNFHAFLWASGGGFSDFLIHNIDECCWMKEAWPVEAKGSGGRHFRGDYVDQNFDSYSVEYTFEDGSKMLLNGRTMPGCHQEFASYAHGTKGSAVISTASHTPAKCKIYKGQKMTKSDLAWQYPPDEPNPYQLEWNHLIAAIREDKPYNEVERGVKASVVTAMGRMASHTGQTVTYDDMLNCEHELAPEVDKLTLESDAPLKADADGKYPVPQPGIVTRREY
ncbi:MAG: Gfo/Idh/MocA family oxidoreductase [Pirellulaceae bacterium]|nr:Gfo/Idh/MocA family oxidoreductase [Pirellulaceae bacterium]